MRVPQALQPYLQGREVLEPVTPLTLHSPKLVALDIDGTLFANVPSTGQVEETHQRAASSTAVRRAYDAGAHVVLATGRSTFGITHVWDLLGLPRRRRRPCSRSPATAR